MQWPSPTSTGVLREQMCELCHRRKDVCPSGLLRVTDASKMNSSVKMECESYLGNRNTLFLFFSWSVIWVPKGVRDSACSSHWKGPEVLSKRVWHIQSRHHWCQEKILITIFPTWGSWTRTPEHLMAEYLSTPFPKDLQMGETFLLAFPPNGWSFISYLWPTDMLQSWK